MLASLSSLPLSVPFLSVPFHIYSGHFKRFGQNYGYPHIRWAFYTLTQHNLTVVTYSQI